MYEASYIDIKLNEKTQIIIILEYLNRYGYKILKPPLGANIFVKKFLRI